MKKLNDFLSKNAQGDLISWQAQVQAAEEFGFSLHDVEKAILTLNLLPARYQRNRQTISTADQLKLFESKVAVIGCGGLGGYIVEELSRLGVGTIKAIDPDVFEEHNLNRQVLCRVSNLGKSKARAAEVRVHEINPAVKVIPIKDAFSRQNGLKLLEGINIVADALDNVPTRIDLARICEFLEIPLVHGTIGGWYGQVTTQWPGEGTIQKIYRDCAETKGVERTLGNPAFTPAVIASLEVAEICKALLDQGTSLRQRMLFINMLDMEIDEIQIC
ncbi:MAG: putative adenylyltransferase/sulfurtransferase MoeZ [Syntrophorhabdus sp. PtaU1.Bin002]|nr:MAG: putative adenylyltransferase/sulfurtransferase MoeZ [Syntrophorhabdus sp. PtaU1.Bin002]